MNVLAEARVLLQLARGSARGDSHAGRLQAFYAPQASYYDVFRERLLYGRADLMRRLAPPAGAVVVELGGGTGRNLEFLGARVQTLRRIEIVDLCPALLAQARARCARWPGVAVAIEADVTSYRPGLAVDCVYFSYALTMIPNWRAAVDNAIDMLRPGGVLGVVDFYLPPMEQVARGRRLRRLEHAFWRRWFAHDGVMLDAERQLYVAGRTDDVWLEERSAAVPYIPGLRVPYYLYIGRKPAR